MSTDESNMKTVGAIALGFLLVIVLVTLIIAGAFWGGYWRWANGVAIAGVAVVLMVPGLVKSNSDKGSGSDE